MYEHEMSGPKRSNEGIDIALYERHQQFRNNFGKFKLIVFIKNEKTDEYETYDKDALAAIYFLNKHGVRLSKFGRHEGKEINGLSIPETEIGFMVMALRRAGYHVILWTTPEVRFKKFEPVRKEFRGKGSLNDNSFGELRGDSKIDEALHERYRYIKYWFKNAKVIVFVKNNDTNEFDTYDDDANTMVLRFKNEGVKFSRISSIGKRELRVVSLTKQQIEYFEKDLKRAGFEIVLWDFPEKGVEGFGAVKKKAPLKKVNTRAVSNHIKPDKIFHPGNVERISEDIYFIRRFINMIDKEKTKDQVLKFIHALQKAIKERRLRKVSPRAKDIEAIQGWAVQFYNSMKGNKGILKISDKEKKRLNNFVEKEVVYASIKFVKKFILLNGEEGRDAKLEAKSLLEKITDSVNKGLIAKKDPYYNDILRIKAKLAHFSSAKGGRKLQIEKQELKGLEGIVEDVLEGPDDEHLMNSVDFAGMEFETIGLQGKWEELMGNPSNNFTGMVYGKPKMGKSYLCIDFAGHLARNHGKVLYVAKEEGLNGTLQQKLHDKEVVHPNLIVSSYTPKNLGEYDFVFLDSVNSLGMNVDDVKRLKERNPNTSFIFVFQTTKNGNFRGPNTFQHFVDVVIEVPEKGLAVQNGRFNQGGEMRIFED